MFVTLGSGDFSAQRDNDEVQSVDGDIKEEDSLERKADGVEVDRFEDEHGRRSEIQDGS